MSISARVLDRLLEMKLLKDNAIRLVLKKKENVCRGWGGRVVGLCTNNACQREREMVFP